MLRFSNVKIDEGWGSLTADGEYIWTEHLPLTARAIFSICVVNAIRFAVVLDLSGLSEAELSQLQHDNPPWADDVVLVRSMRPGHDKTAIIDIIGGRQTLQSSAIAAACSAFDTGSFDFVPTEYRVSNESETVALRIEFDEDSESWLAFVE